MTYPDGEEVNYTYNTGGLLTSVASSANSYVSDIKYDKFEQRSYMRYGNGTETNYTYNPLNRRMDNLSVNNTTATLMNNAYTYDAVSNVTKVINSGSAIATTSGNGIGGAMTHNYQYDNLYRLKSANGTFTGYNGKTASYTLGMGYDDMHNITSKSQNIEQNNVQFAGTLNAGYNLSYNYAANCQQISNIADDSYRYASGESQALTAKTQNFSYDANGNLLSIQTGTKQSDKLLATNSRKMLWDEENRLLAVSDNGFVSNYWYDAAGERTVKESGDNEGVNVNGLKSAGRTGTTNFTAYISPYLVVNNGGNYTKHIYMGGQRITSKVSNSEIFEQNPVTTIDLQAKYTAQTAKIKERFDSLGVVYKGTAQSGGLITKNPTTEGKIGANYFYHSDHLGSSSLISDQNGTIVQHLEYVPFGETFIDERRSASSWNTPYLFSGKERDEETGLLYFGARYQDSKYGIWYSVDPLAEKTPNVGGYVYCHGNPVNFIDVWGMYDKQADANKDQKIATKIFGASRVGAVHNAGTDKTPDYRFSVFKKGQDKNTHPIENGVKAYKSDQVVDNRSQLNNYVDKNSNPNFHRLPFRFFESKFITGDSYFGGAINTDHNSYYNYILGDKNLIQQFQHEFGHFLQEENYGKKYYLKIAGYSLLNFNHLIPGNEVQYNSSWTEMNANTLSYYYFNCPSGWNKTGYPLDCVQPIFDKKGVTLLFVGAPKLER
jgi:RHS repeat-associated protein